MPAFSLPVANETDEAHALTLLEPKFHRRFELAPTRTAENARKIEIADQDVVALELEGGFRLWMSGARLRVEAARPSRDGDGWQLSPGLALEDSDRGAGTWLIKTLEVFGLDPVAMGVAALAQHIERNNDNKILHYRRGENGGWTPVDGGIPASPDPVLLFIHGTFSSTEGSFGDLFADRRLRGELSASYGERVFGYEHRTLTEDPIDNLLALAPLLAKGLRLHLISHSRGGLVGDLLALAARGGAPPFSAEELACFDFGGPHDADTRAAQRAKLERLGELMRDRDIRIERFVRVASPSRGTSLASGRLDRWLSILANLADFGATVGPVSPLVGGFLDFTVAVTQMATDPKELPGLAAMDPGSPLVGMLNRVSGTVPGDLSVVAGDVQASGLWSKAKLLIPDLFFAGDHDLVVNTGSMYGGPAYASRYALFDQGPQVSHFNYFSNESSAPMAVAALTGPEPAPGFGPIEPAMAVAPARRARGGAERRPVLFVLPGIMGSTLEVDGRLVWIDMLALASGGLSDLALDAGHRVTPREPYGRAYGDLLNFFAASHDLVPFAYDWRLSIAESAADLAAAVERKLDQAERHHQPVRILAHSMGGLVARAMIADHPGLWQRIRAHPGGRLVMLGTPNGGSWEAVRLLTGRSATLKKLALVDLPNNTKELLEVISEFPGVLELLPDDDHAFFDRAAWERLHAQDQAGSGRWPLPGHAPASGGKSRLQKAGDIRRRLRAEAVGPDAMLYVAGQARDTPSGMRVVDEPDLFLEHSTRKTLQFSSSGRGDGTVLWQDGPLPNMQTWYMPGVEHGDLANSRPGFPAIKALLTQGATSDLPQRQPVSRGADVPRSMADYEPAYYPDEASILASALGMGPERPREPPRAATRVWAVHGNLAFARYAVAVGHYTGDTLIAAEAYLDRVLAGRLRASMELNIYPGPLGTHSYFAHPHANGVPQGALVVGLGAVGVLTPADLSDSFAHALLGLARALVERSAPDEARQRDIGLSSVLIGTGAGGFSVRESVRALLRGVVRANGALARSERSRTVRFAAIELIEIRENLAIDAARALRDASMDPELEGGFDCEPILRLGEGGHHASFDETDPAWWHRLQILSDERGGMRFTYLTRRARAEESLLATQRALVDSFVSDAIGTTTHGTATSRTLFEMLLPNRLKDGGDLRANMVLVLDAASARFPWELLEDRWSKDAKPPAVERGLLRQLQTSIFRADPRLTERGRALVVGEPQSGLAELPGARAEAERVRATLSAQGFNVSLLVRASAARIMATLHAEAYQILHLAGHGVHEQPLAAGANGPRCAACQQPLPHADPQPQSGMVIGPGQVLTAADVKQMRQVPELVFINCCHLGRTDRQAGTGPSLKDSNRLAANLAVAFIGMGVRAVIAAGWAVDDAAALTFCEAFYARMHAGHAFGEAVRLAREETWSDHPGCNTWGAYQCYGDPDFRIQCRDRDTGPEPELHGYVAPAEVIAELHNLRADAQVAAQADSEYLCARLEHIDRRLARTKDHCGADWGRRANLLAARGLACFELGLFQEADRDLEAAIASQDPGIGRDLIDHRARCRARVATDLHVAGDTKRALALFDRALQELDAYEGLAPGRRSVGGIYSRSDIYWRKILVVEPSERKALLDTILTLYAPDRAAATNAPADGLNAYTQLLWLTANYLVTAYRRRSVDEQVPDFDAWCNRIKARAGRREEGGISDEVTTIQVNLLSLIRHRGTLEKDKELHARLEEIAGRLETIIRRGLSNRQWSGLKHNLDVLENLLLGATVSPAQRREDAAIVSKLLRRFPQF